MACEVNTDLINSVQRDFHRAFFNFRLSMVIAYALRFSIFQKLAVYPLTLDELCAVTNLEKEKLSAVCEVLISHSFLQRCNEGKLILSKYLADEFANIEDSPLLSIILMDLSNREKWDSFIRNDQFDIKYDKDKIYNSAMCFESRNVIKEIYKLVVDSGCHYLIEVGSGPGELSAQFIKLGPNNRALCIDYKRKPSLMNFELSSEQLSRVSWRNIDIINEDIPSIIGAYVLSRVLMGYSNYQKEKILSSIKKSMKNGCRLIINEFDPSTKVGSLIALDVQVNWAIPICSIDTLCEIVTNVGFTIVNVSSSSKYSKIIICEK